jgi:F0F1-type ATP synthase membrane subunit b/b'
MPLSTAAIVNRDEALELLDEAVIRLPEELRQARWLLKEREEFLDRARREAEEIVEAARSRAEHMVQRTEVVREAQRVARATVERAEAEGRQIRNQAEDYVDEKLAGFEVTLQRTLAAVGRGRRRLQAIVPLEAPTALPEPPEVFDQDA